MCCHTTVHHKMDFADPDGAVYVPVLSHFTPVNVFFSLHHPDILHTFTRILRSLESSLISSGVGSSVQANFFVFVHRQILLLV